MPVQDGAMGDREGGEGATATGRMKTEKSNNRGSMTKIQEVAYKREPRRLAGAGSGGSSVVLLFVIPERICVTKLVLFVQLK